MTDAEIVDALKAGYKPTFGVNGRNMDVVKFMAALEKLEFIQTVDIGLSQETRRRATWTGQADIPTDVVLSIVAEAQQ